MKFKFLFFQKTALSMAVEKGNLEIAKLLLANPTIDVNIETIFNIIIFIIFQYANF